MTRYMLGLRPRFDLGDKHYELNLKPGSLTNASGKLPIPGGGVIQINWKKMGNQVSYTIVTAVPITIHVANKDKPVKVIGKASLTLTAN